MRSILPRNAQFSHGWPRGAGWLAPLAALALALCAAQMPYAQKPPTTAPHSAPRAAHAHAAGHRLQSSRARISRARMHDALARKRHLAAPAVPQVAAVALPPAAPPPPVWPVNEKPSPATVTWDSHGLSIDAANSSLMQILRDVSTATGARVEGLNRDERIFGTYGPGPAREVIAQLLHGSGYNMVMIGDQGAGTPLKIILTQRTAGTAQPAASQTQDSDDDASDLDDQPSPPPSIRPGYGPSNRFDPQERQREMQMMQERRRMGTGAQPQQPDNPQL